MKGGRFLPIPAEVENCPRGTVRYQTGTRRAGSSVGRAATSPDEDIGLTFMLI